MSVSSTKQLIDPREILTVVRKRKWLIIIPWILVSIVVFAGSYFLPPVYQSFAIVRIDQDVKLSTDLQGLLGMARSYRDEGRADRLRSYYNELTSLWYVSQVNERLKLDQDPDLVALATKAATAQPGVTLDQAKLYILQDRLKGRISANFAGGDQIVINVESEKPEQAQAIANTLSEIFIAERLKQELTSIRSSQDFSDVQLSKYEKELQDKINERTTYERNYLKQQLPDAVTSEANRNLVSAEVNQIEDEIKTSQTREKDLLIRLNRVEGLAGQKLQLKESEQHTRLAGDLKEQVRSLADLATNVPWSDAQILNYRLKQNASLSNIGAETKRLVKEQFSGFDESTHALLTDLFTTRAGLDFYYSKASFLKASLELLKDRVGRQPEFQATIDRLNREIMAATDLRDKFKKQQESSSISQALAQDMSSSKYRVVEPAKIPLAPIRPDRVKIVLIGIFLGLMIGGGAMIVAELADSSFKKVDDVERYLGLKVLGVAPKVEFLTRVK